MHTLDCICNFQDATAVHRNKNIHCFSTPERAISTFPKNSSKAGKQEQVEIPESG